MDLETGFYIYIGLATALAIASIIIHLSTSKPSAKLSKDTSAETISPEDQTQEISIQRTELLKKTPEGESITEVSIEVVEKLTTELPKEKELSLVEKLKTGLKKTNQGIFSGLERVFSGSTLSDELLDELEEVLFSADLGADAVERLVGKLREKKDSNLDLSKAKAILAGEVENIFKELESQNGVQVQAIESSNWSGKPHVILVAGVNGAGKTTTIGKLATKFKAEGKKVLLGAADTFRAAAIDQLQVWADRSGVDIFRKQEGSDPASVAYESVEKAKSGGYDVVIIDTAGRLHTKSSLMDELKKVKKVISKLLPDAPHESLLVLDAVTGQNALHQAREFHAALGISGLILTKLDGSSKGGSVVGISSSLGLPVHYIGIGEKVDDLRAFDAKSFAEALLG